MKLSNSNVIKLSLCTVFLLHTNLFAEEKREVEKIVSLDTITVMKQRDKRESKGAIGLLLDIKDTPQSITSISSEEMAIQGAVTSNQALELMTGIDVQAYETNRAVFNSRGLQIQLTQIDGMGTTNDYATVVGEHDTFMFEKIELIRGANALLTGVGNSSGTINYVRKRPTNIDEGLVSLSAGSYKNLRGAVDYNKILTENGDWAGRIILSKENKESHIRSLENDRTSIYAVVDGQIGDNGVLTIGASYQKNDQDSPTWGSLTLNYLNGGHAEFDISSSTSADWTYWNTKTKNAFIEYLHLLGNSWEAKVTYNWNTYDSESKLLYGYTPTGGLNNDNTGIVGWAYAGFTKKESKVLDANINGEFDAFGQTHSVLAGISYIEEANDTYNRDVLSGNFLPFPDFSVYNGSTYAQPVWGDKQKRGDGNKKLTRFYMSSRLGITDDFHAILGVNSIKLEREGSSIYGNVPTQTNYPDLKETSPYIGLTYDVTQNTLVYASYSNIFQNQDNTDYFGNYLDPMEGINYEVGVKSEFFNKRLLTTLAFFSAEQKGFAIKAPGLNAQGQSYYVSTDIDSKGIEFESLGKINENTRIGFGLTHVKLEDVNGNRIAQWVPKTTINLRLDSKIEQVPGLRLGMNAKWKSDAYREGGSKQDAFIVANAFGSYDIDDKSTIRVNVNNVFNKKYLQGIQYGGIYGAPINAQVTYEYKF